MKRKYNLIQPFDERLRKVSMPVTIIPGITSFWYERLIHDMIDILKETNGAAIAAPQVGVNKRIIVMRTDLAGDSIGKPGVRVMFNPEFYKVGFTDVNLMEGCLSLPGYRVIKKRNDSVRVYYRTPTDNAEYERLYGVASQALQHEVDHLDGKVIFTDPAGELIQLARSRVRRIETYA